MRSIFSIYDDYKQGKYIKDSSQTTMDYLEILEELPDEQRLVLMRIRDEQVRKHEIFFMIAVMAYLIVGFGLGYVLFA